MTTLITGARGAVGRHVLDGLLALGEPVRASARNPVAAGLPAGVPVVAADLTVPASLDAALDGVRQVFLYAPSDGAAGFVEAARRSGVEHVVLLSSGSVLLPQAAGNAITREHRAVEDALDRSGLRWTAVRPLVLASNALNWAGGVRAGVVRLVHPEAETAPIHERDIAAVAVAALTGSALGGPGVLLTGGELLTQRRQVELIGGVTGRPVRVEELSERQARVEFGAHGDPEVVDAILEFIADAARGGSPATTGVRDVLGREPVGFAEWAVEHAAEFSPAR
jgi:uncharacterized protein YbjT (DUF2867 family)